MEEALLALWAGLPVFVAHSSASILMLIFGVLIYVRITPHDERKLIREGNAAATLSLAGTILGLAIPIAVSLSASVSIWDLVFWGIVALIFQILAFRITDLFMRGVSKKLEAGDMATAIFLVSVKLATAFINAAAISG